METTQKLTTTLVFDAIKDHAFDMDEPGTVMAVSEDRIAAVCSIKAPKNDGELVVRMLAEAFSELASAAMGNDPEAWKTLAYWYAARKQNLQKKALFEALEKFEKEGEEA